MTQPGEGVHLMRQICMICGTALYLRVMSNDAGYYIGFYCPRCGPYSRESGYFFSRGEAKIALDSGGFCRP